MDVPHQPTEESSSPHQTNEPLEEHEEEEFQSRFKENTNETKKPKSRESTSIPTFPRESDGNTDGLNTSDHETVIEEAVESDDLWEHFNCDLASKFFKKRSYEAMERVLVNVDKKTKSAMGRGRFATMISKGCNDFAELHDCINHHVTDVDAFHHLICQQLISLAESHREILQEMEVETQCNTFGEWVKLSEAVFRHNSTLEYGSFEWQKVISKTKELSQFFSSLPNAARNVSKSYILLILQFTCRVWLTRNHILPGDHHGLLRIATFCLPLCESELVKSKYYCKSKHDVYVHAAITLGCTISNRRLDVETWYDEFCTFTLKSEQYYDEGLQLQIDLRSEDDTSNLTKFTRIVETRMAAYISTCDFEDDSEPKPRDTIEHQKLTDRHVNQIMKHWSCKSFSEFRQSIIDAEDVLLEAHFKLKIGSLLSPTFNQLCDALNGSFKQLRNPRALFESLHSNLMDLVVDCKRLLKELKVYSNDSLADWVEVFFGFCSSDECSYGSVRWMEALDRGQNAVDDTTRGVDPTGRAIMQLYVQLIIELVVEAFVAYEHLNSNDRIGHVRLASMNMTMVKSPLLTNKWYSKTRYNVYICGVRSLAACILKEDPPAQYTFYEQYKAVKEILDLLVVESRKLNVPLSSKQDRHKLSTLHKDVERKIFGVQDGGYVRADDLERRQKTIASDPSVAQQVSLAVGAYHKRNFDQMTKHLDSAEEEDGSCDVRLAFAGNVSTNFDLVVTFSNNIPEPRGPHVVEETTKKNLRYLANDHQKVMEHMGEKRSDIMEVLIVGLFEQTGAKPGTSDWKFLKNKALEMVKYFEGLTENGHSVTKAYVLLFLTVLHNFIATRNRLCRGEHDKLLPFIMPCVIICESVLLESDAWIKTKFDVYEIAVLETGSSLGTGQIPCAPFFPKYSRILQELTAKAAKCNIYVCDDNQQRQIDNVRKVGDQFYRGSEDRMCIIAAILYYKAGCYTGLMAILNAADQTSSAVNIRMNFTMRVSSTFEKCVDYHNSISDESTYVELVRNSYLYLCKASEDFSDFVKKMGETESNDLRSWVDELFQATNSKPSLNPVLELKSVTEKGQIAAQYIMRMSAEARCIAQIYLNFFMSFIVNFITRRHALHTKDIYNGGLKITLALIILCKDVLVTSSFSIKKKTTGVQCCGIIYDEGN
ncbi:uncharacterized protein LOC117109250 [Anneissia japonica]|uniref:uncharacterized protein LOC117109250 n=1 Tax=Anneissia japonica TaxID=1529436 RepID=UPI0014259BA5|nr:uncharacterized protein LOC117109250 [Anneissia japonica]